MNGPNGLNTPPVLIEEACGVTYEFTAPKIPLYGYRDKQFSAVAEGKQLVSGLLLMNKGFKDALAAVIRFMISQRDIEANEESSLRSNDLIKVQTIASTNATDANSLMTESRALQRLIDSSDAFATLEAVRLRTYKDVNLTKLDQIGEAINTVGLGRVPAFPSLEGTLADPLNTAAVDLLNIIGDIESDQTDINDDIETNGILNLATLYNIKDLSNSIKESAGKIHAIINTVQLEANQLATSIRANTEALSNIIEIVVGDLVVPLAGTEIFESLTDTGRSIDLQIHFGQEGINEDFHVRILQECWFSTESVQVSIDDRDVIKDAFAFIAKTIK